MLGRAKNQTVTSPSSMFCCDVACQLTMMAWNGLIMAMLMGPRAVASAAAGFVTSSSSFGGFLHRQQHLVKRCMTTKTTTTSPFPMLENKNLVSVQDCLEAAAVSKNGLVFCDASWYHKGGRNGRAEFEQGPRIQGARYIDMDDIATSKELFPELNPKGLRTMMPTKKLFALAMDALDIQNSDHIIIYAKEGTVFTPRTWFLFRSMGHDPSKVHLMQGPLEEFMESGGAVETNPVSVFRAGDLKFDAENTKYQARDATNVVNMDEMLRVVLAEEDSIILDPRGSSFTRYGHIPGARHVPYSSLVEPDNSLQLKPRQQLLQIFKKAGVDPLTENRIVCSCGSGVSVCHLLLALEECGRDLTQLPTDMYDGSYQEWGSDPNTPKVLPNEKQE